MFLMQFLIFSFLYFRFMDQLFVFFYNPFLMAFLQLDYYKKLQDSLLKYIDT